MSGPYFNLDVPPDGYAWWYVDGISDDGDARRLGHRLHRVGVFALVSLVGPQNPAESCCINVATYGPRRALHDDRPGRSRAAPVAATRLQVGPSSMHWTGDELIIDIDEISARRMVSRVAGTITLTPAAVTEVELPLTPDGAHVWRPFAPIGRHRGRPEPAGLALDRARLFRRQFRHPRAGGGFQLLDLGPVPAAATGRPASTTRPAATVSTWRGGRVSTRTGSAREIAPPPPRPLRAQSLWAVRRETRADAGYQPRQVKRDAGCAVLFPVAVRNPDRRRESRPGVHEALDLDRFRHAAAEADAGGAGAAPPGWDFDD